MFNKSEGRNMKPFKAKNGIRINPDRINSVKCYQSQRATWSVKFNFGNSDTEEILFNSEKEAYEEVERFDKHCEME